MGKSKHRKDHKKKVSVYKNQIQENRRLEKKRRQEIFSKLQEQYMKEQQTKEQEKVLVDQDLKDEMEDFKLEN